MPCKLTPIPHTPDFSGAVGDSVTLAARDHIGVVMFAAAEYAGAQLVPSGTAVSTIQFKVAAGKNTIKMVFVFTASTSGVGELREEAPPDSQFMRPLAGGNPFQAIKIVGVGL